MGWFKKDDLVMAKSEGWNFWAGRYVGWTWYAPIFITVIEWDREGGWYSAERLSLKKRHLPFWKIRSTTEDEIKGIRTDWAHRGFDKVIPPVGSRGFSSSFWTLTWGLVYGFIIIALIRSLVYKMWGA